MHSVPPTVFFMQNAEIPLYVPHEGTIKISGRTSSRNAARCALHYMERGVTEIDFFYIGGNAGQQAMKAMGIFRYVVESMSNGSDTVFFQPNRVQTEILEEGMGAVKKDAVYWRPFVINIHDFTTLLTLSKLPKYRAKPTSIPDDEEDRSG